MIRDAFLVQVIEPRNIHLRYDQYKDSHLEIDQDDKSIIYGKGVISSSQGGFAGCQDFSVLSYREYMSSIAQETGPTRGWNDLYERPVFEDVFWTRDRSGLISYFKASIGVLGQEIDTRSIFGGQGSLFSESTEIKLSLIPGFRYKNLLNTITSDLVVSKVEIHHCDEGFSIYNFEGKLHE